MKKILIYDELDNKSNDDLPYYKCLRDENGNFIYEEYNASKIIKFFI